MKCPKCGKKFEGKTNYNPTTKKNDLPYTTYTHIYTLAQLFTNPELCKHTIRVDDRK